MDIFKPKGIHLKQYHPKCMLNVVRKDLSCVRCMLQHPFIASHFEYVVEPASLCVISSNVGALWCLQIMALLISFGSR